MALKYTRWPQCFPNGHKMFQHFPFPDPPKFSQIRNFGFKINNLTTLSSGQSFKLWHKKLDPICAKLTFVAFVCVSILTHGNFSHATYDTCNVPTDTFRAYISYLTL
jgi:hypothetical protein